jgi:AraC family transcriptional regulator, ethanolamine operon transcriptional activator
MDVATAGTAALPLPSRSNPFVTTARFNDAGELARLFKSKTQCIQLSAGAFSAEALSGKFGAVQVLAVDCSRGIELRRRVPTDRLSICYTASAERIWDRGHPWDARHMLGVSGDDIEISTLSAGQLRWIDVDLALCPQAERESFMRMAGRRTLLMRGENAAATQLRGYAAMVFQLCANSPLRLSSEAMRERLERDILVRVDRALRSAELEPTAAKRERKAFLLVRRVEQFMWQNVDEPLTLQRIGKQMNCRMRSLIYSFKDSFGIGPITYLKILRLNEAHRRLREARGDVRIFDVAVALGFWHMGHFSADYKRMFGETASETLAEARAGSRSLSDAALQVPKRPTAVH